MLEGCRLGSLLDLRGACDLGGFLQGITCFRGMWNSLLQGRGRRFWWARLLCVDPLSCPPLVRNPENHPVGQRPCQPLCQPSPLFRVLGGRSTPTPY